ncbi:MAG TPA: HEAT repeat domain-containing protein [Blastocatellia bacterium]|nr:HEAT repeat domain-containing protein [Blastocatellia bacterium]
MSYNAFALIPVPSLDIEALTRDSSLIIVGEAMSVRDGGSDIIQAGGRSITARRMVVDLNVTRTIKGQVAASMIAFSYLLPRESLGYSGVSPRQFGMFFLRSDPQKGLVVSNPYYPAVVAAPDPPPAKGNDFERVVSEVAQVLISTMTSIDDRLQSVMILDSVNTPSATMALHRAVEAADRRLRLRAIASLLRRDDISYLNLAEKALMQDGRDSDSNLLGWLAFALEGVRNRKALPSLTRLLNAHSPQVRRSAVYAIRNTGDSAAITPLSKALYDTDQAVRYQAVIGLAEISNQPNWGPSVELFNKDEQRYLVYWRNWVKGR